MGVKIPYDTGESKKNMGKCYADRYFQAGNCFYMFVAARCCTLRVSDISDLFFKSEYCVSKYKIVFI